MEKPQLRRRLNLTMITLYGLGTTVGGGIYVLVGTVAGRAGLYAPFSFLVAAFMVALTALSFGELASRFPKSAGEAVYVKEGFGIAALATVVGYLVIFNGVVSSAALSEGFVGYFQTFLAVPDWVAIVGVVLLLGALACWGIGESVIIASFITVVEIGGLALIIWVGRDAFAQLPAMSDQMIPPLDSVVWSGIMAGSFLAFYAFIGFEDMVNVAEEVKNPERTLPLGIILTLSLTTLIYVLTITVVVLSAPIDELAASDVPLTLVYQSITGESGQMISLISILAVLNGALIQIIMASRVLYGMAAQGWSLAVFARIHPLTRTPVTATIVVVGLSVVLALLFEIDILAQTTSLVILIIAMLTNLSLFRIKLRSPASRSGINLPKWVPLAGFCVSTVFGYFLAIDLAGNLSALF